MQKYIDILKQEFNNYLKIKEKRPGIYQLYLPLYHADGDMMDIFISESKTDNNLIRICDYGMTLMRLSYTYDVDTANKEKIFNKILAEYNVTNEKGNLFLEIGINELYPALMQFAQTISKVTNMRLFKREVIHSLFFEMLEEFIMSNLNKYKPQKKYYPIPGHDEYEVDYCFNSRPRPIFLFGVNNSSYARLATISCQKFITDNIKFRSLIVLEDLEILGKKDQARLMSAADKEFPDFEEFKIHAEEYLERDLQ